jgi:hypothetical protein
MVRPRLLGSFQLLQQLFFFFFRQYHFVPRRLVRAKQRGAAKSQWP